MTFAGVQSGRVMGLAGLVVFCWSVAATAQPASTSAPPAQTPAKPPESAPAKGTAGATKVAPAPGTASGTGKAAPAAGAPAAGTAPGTAKSAPAVGTAKAVPGAPAAGTTKNAPATSKSTTTAPAASDASAPAKATPDAPASGTAAPGTAGESWVAPASGQGPANAAGSNAGTTSPWSDANGQGAPPVYYVEQTPNPAAAPAPPPSPPPASATDDLDPIRMHIEEPPPPPVPRHRAPKSAFWLGARVGYFVPFGDLWGRCSSAGYSACDHVEGTKFSDVAATGPMFELDVGARIGRNYVIYLGWERAQLGGASGPSPDASIGDRQSRAESDFFAVGVRLSADPDEVGLLLDLSIGARRFRGLYANDVELQLTDAPLESRLGIGVDIRTSRLFSLSPMLTLGLGSFGKAEWVTADTVQSAVPANNDRLTHGWVTLQLGGHFDVAGGN